MNFRESFQVSDIPFLRGPENRHHLSRSAAYCGTLFLALPTLVGGLLPGLLHCDTDPSGGVGERLLLLVASGAISAFAAWVPALLLVRWRAARSAYLSLLLPLALIAQTAQVIFFRAFGTQIDERILGLFQDNVSALWAYARAEYHIDWVIGAACLLSAAMAWNIHRRRNWFPRIGPRAALAAAAAGILSTTLATALQLNVDRVSPYSSAKLGEAPLYRVALFARSVFSERSNPGIATALRRSGEIEADGPYEEIVRRLGAAPEDHLSQKSSRPRWLKRQPEHVFCFILESFEQDFIDLPEMETMAPRLRRFSREGIAVPRMISASGATIDAVHAALAGVTAQPGYPGPRSLEQFELDTLPRILRQAGYRTAFYAGSHRKFGGKGDAAESYGFETFTGCPDVATDIPANEWGVDDARFFLWARSGPLKSLSAPHFVTFLNVSNHPPFSAPVDGLWSDEEIPEAVVKRFAGGSREEKCRYAKHVRYADQELGAMVDWLDATYPGSLFVFFGDHCGTRFRREKSDHVPFILWGAEVVDAGIDSSRWYGAQMDIPATLAQLVLPEGSRFRSLGRPVWDDSPGRVSVGSDHVMAGGGGASGVAPRLLDLGGGAPSGASSPDLPARLKGSALHALSWAYLNHEPLGAQPTGRTLAAVAQP